MSLQFTLAEEADSTGADPGAEGTGRAPVVLQASEGGTLVVPGGAFLLTADYARVGGDLVLQGEADQPAVIVRDFFALDDAPTLRSEGGAQVAANIAARLAGSPSPGQYAAEGDAAGAEPIGKVVELVGEASITRVDGSKTTLARDVPVYQGDVIETDGGAALQLVFIDESTLAVGENGRVVLDELVFDAATLEGTSTVALLQGLFVFVTGEIAQHNPDQMVITTPVALIGVRGTGTAVEAAQEGEENRVILLPEKTPEGEVTVGAIRVSNEAGAVLLDEAYETTLIDSIFSLPLDPYLSSPEEVAFLLRQLMDLVPASVEHVMAAGRVADLDAAIDGVSAESVATLGQPISENEAEAAAAQLSAVAPAAGPPEGASGAPDEVIQATDVDILETPTFAAPFAPSPPPAFTPAGFVAPSQPSGAPPDEGTAVDDNDVIAGASQPAPPPPPPPPPPDPDVTILGSDADETFITGTGNDVIVALAGNDTLIGGGGNDVLQGQADDDVLDGGNGNDFLVGGPGSDSLIGGIGNDLYLFLVSDGDGNSDTIFDEAGTFDRLQFESGLLVYLSANPGGDLHISINGGLSTVEVIGHYSGTPIETLEADFLGAGLDFFQLLTSNTLGTAGPDAIAGLTNVANVITGFGGDDVLFGQGFDDVLSGGADNDILFGGGGNDVLESESGDDVVIGGDGQDLLIGGTDSDLLLGGEGNDHYQWVTAHANNVLVVDTVDDAGGSSDQLTFDVGGQPLLSLLPAPGGNLEMTYNGQLVRIIDHYAGQPIEFITADFVGLGVAKQYFLSTSNTTGTINGDVVVGLEGISNQIFGFEGDDALFGQSLDDLIEAGFGDDIVDGGAGNDLLSGLGDDDQLFGSEGNDILLGDVGDDMLSGGAGEDFLLGGENSDLLLGGADNDIYAFLGLDGSNQIDIVDDDTGTADTLDFAPDIALFNIVQNGNDLEFWHGDGNFAIVANHFGAKPVEQLIYDFGDGELTYAVSTGHGPGTPGNDIIVGDQNAVSTLSGDAGADVLVGRNTSGETLDGGPGNDILVSAGGVDELTGGTEADSFVYRNLAELEFVPTNTPFAGQAAQVTDFSSGEDTFVFFNEAFGFAAATEGLLSDVETNLGQTLFSTVSNYDGTLVVPGATQQFVFDPTSNTLYFDPDLNTAGYTVVAQVQSAGTVTSSDIELSDFKVGP